MHATVVVTRSRGHPRPAPTPQAPPELEQVDPSLRPPLRRQRHREDTTARPNAEEADRPLLARSTFLAEPHSAAACTAEISRRRLQVAPTRHPAPPPAASPPEPASPPRATAHDAASRRRSPASSTSQGTARLRAKGARQGLRECLQHPPPAPRPERVDHAASMPRVWSPPGPLARETRGWEGRLWGYSASIPQASAAIAAA